MVAWPLAAKRAVQGLKWENDTDGMLADLEQRFASSVAPIPAPAPVTVAGPPADDPGGAAWRTLDEQTSGWQAAPDDYRPGQTAQASPAGFRSLDEMTAHWTPAATAQPSTGAPTIPGPDQTPQGAPVRSAGEMSADTPPEYRPPTQTGAIADVTPDEGVTRESVTRSAAAALTKAGLPAGMAPYLAGIAINEGILQPGTIARDFWSVGGVKAPGSGGSVTVPTREVINGQSVMQTASFGRFGSMQEGMDALAAFVRDSPNFGPVTRAAAQSGDYAGLIQGFKDKGYATDPNWVSQVNSIAAGLPVPQAPSAPQRAAAGPSDADRYDVAFGFNQAYDNPFNPNIPRHRGVDLVVRGGKDGGRGSPVTAFRGGTVYAVTNDPNGGNGLIVATGDPDAPYDYYGHFDATNVKQGQQIQPGEPIGVLGASGTEGFPHLHYEVRRAVNGDPMDQLIDPTPYMRGAGRPTQTAGVPPAPAAPQPPAAQQPTPAVAAGGTRTSEIGQTATAGDPLAMKTAEPMPEDASSSERYADSLNTTLPTVPPPFRNEVPFDPETGQAGWPGMQRAPLDGSTPVRDNWASDQSQQPIDPDQGPREATPGSVGAQPAVYDPRIADEATSARELPVQQVAVPQAPVGGGYDDPGTQVTAPRGLEALPPDEELAPRPEDARPAYGPPLQSTAPISPAIPAVQNARSAVEGGLELAPRELPNPTAPAARVYQQTIEEARADEDRFFTENAPTIARFSRESGVPLEQIHRGLRIARDVVLATPQATADTINAVLEPIGLGRSAIGVNVPAVGTVGIADFVDLPGPMAGVTNLGMARGSVTRAANTAATRAAQNIPDLAGAIERGTGAAIGAARSGIGTAIRGAGRALEEGRATARALNEAPSGGMVLPGTLGISPDENMMRGLTRGRVVPPEVADTLDQFPVRVPDDPATVRAIEAVGGTVDPERGVTLTVTRAQAPTAAGGSATRGGVFYEAVPEGGRSSFVGADNPHSVGGSQVIPPQKTRFRSPLILSDAPGEMRGFNAAMEQLDVRNRGTAEEIARAEENLASRRAYVERYPQPPGSDYVAVAERELAELRDGIPLVAADIDSGIRIAKRAGPAGSPARAQALKDLVSRYGGDPNLIDDLLAIRGADASESAWAIKENILTANARRQGYDGVVTVQPHGPDEMAVLKHPKVVAAEKVLNEADQATQQAIREADILKDIRDAQDPSVRQRLNQRAMNGDETAIAAMARRGSVADPEAEYNAAWQRYTQAEARLRRADAAYTQAQNEARAELGSHKITELVDVREGRNPTPGASREVSLADTATQLDAARAEWRRLAAEVQAGRGDLSALDAAQARVAALEQDYDTVLRTGTQTIHEPSGYALREDVRPRTPEPRSISLNAGFGVVPESGSPRPQSVSRTPVVSPAARDLMETYSEVTPARIQAAAQRAVQLVNDDIARKVPRNGEMPDQSLVQRVHDAIVQGLGSSKVVATGLRKDALAAFLRGEGITSKTATRDWDQITRITQGQVNVGGGRRKLVDGKLQKVPYSLEDAAGFAHRESEQMRAATGGTRFPDPARGGLFDEAAPNVNYAYVTEGQPLVGPNSPDLWLVWDDATPRITSAHHPYALLSPNQDIHQGMPPGLKAALWHDAVQGGVLERAADGSPIVRGWEGSGIRTPGGRTIADTNWLVGPEGEDAMRASGLLMSMPQDVQRAIARGEMRDPEQIAAVLMRGRAVAGHVHVADAAAQSANRSESLILDPNAGNVKAIYLAGSPDVLKRRVPNVPNVQGKTGMTVLETAQAVRQKILAETGVDVPILFTDTKSGGSKLITDAQVLEGPPLQLAPGRGTIRDRYVGAGYEDIGATAGALPRTPGTGVLPAVNRAASEAIVGGTGGAVIEQARNPDEDPRTAAARGFALGAVGFPLATRAARGAARLAGRTADEGGGALASLGHLPVDPARVLSEADAGPIRGANLNRRLPQEGSAIPLRVRAANALTDDQAALRWAEDLLTEDAGRGRLPEDAIARPSALRRRNPDSIAEQRIRDELVPTVARARKDGLLDELTQYLQDTHERDVLAEFYRRGYDDAIEAGKTAAEAETAGLVRMRRRASANTALSYEAVAARLEGQQQRLGDRFGDLDEMASSVWSHNRATLDRLLESGRITPEQHAWMTETYPHYVPTVPVSQLDAGGGRAAVGRGAGVSAGRSGPGDVKAFEDVASGSERLNPIIASRDATIARERVAHRNEVFQAFARLYDEAQQLGSEATQASGGARRQRFAGEVEVSGRVDGEPVSIRVPKPVAEVIDTMAQMGAGGGAVGLWKAAMSAVTTSITGRRLSFAPVNLARDLGDSLLRAGSEYGPGVLPEYLGLWMRQAGNAAVDLAVGAFKGDLPITGAAKEYLRRGGGMGPARGGWKAGEDWYAAAARSGGMPVTGPGDVARILKDLATFKPVMAINERAELISRTAMMQLAERHGAGANEAMIAGRNASIDFQRAGTVVRMFNGAIPFLNATVQSGAQLTRTLRANPKSAAATFATVVGLPVIAAEAYNRSDPQRAQAYDDVPQYLKDQGIVVMLPWAGSDTRGERPNYAWLPLGMGAPVAVAIREAMRDAPGLEPASPRSDLSPDASEPERWANVAAQVFSVFSPIKGESATAAASSLIPPGAKQLVELGTNKNLFTGGQIATDASDERASAFGRSVAGAANEAGRALGSDLLQEVRPSQVDYLGRQLPAYGDIITGTSDLVAPSPAKQAEDRPVQNAPLVGGPAGRLIRDTGGAGLERARNDMLSPTIRDALIDADMRPSDIQAVPSSLSVDGKKIPLMRDEQTRYQERTNVYANREIAATARSSEWRARGADREKLVKEAMARARERAEQEILQRIRPAERQRRVREAEGMKAS